MFICVSMSGVGGDQRRQLPFQQARIAQMGIIDLSAAQEPKHLNCRPLNPPRPPNFMDATSYSVNTKHLYNIYTMSAQRRKRWADVVQMLYKCFVFAWYSCPSDYPPCPSWILSNGWHVQHRIIIIVTSQCTNKNCRILYNTTHFKKKV